MSGSASKMVAAPSQIRSGDLAGLPSRLTLAKVRRQDHRIRALAEVSLNGAVKYGSQGLVESGVVVAASAAASNKDRSGLTRRRSCLERLTVGLESMRSDEDQIKA